MITQTPAQRGRDASETGSPVFVDGHAARDAQAAVQRPSVEPNACRHCGVAEREHYQRWTAEAQWHGWTAPTDAQRLARMRARREARHAQP